MRVLITGASGFVGRHLAAECRRRGADVVGLGRGTPPAETQELLAEYIEVDLVDPDATAETVRSFAPERVFHLAAAASVAESWRAPAETLATNVSSTVNLLEAIRAESPEAPVLIAGSGEVYGAIAPERLPADETTPVAPRNPYSLSKASVELVGSFYADVHDLRIVTTRAFNHAGPGQSDTYVISSFARQIAEAEAQGRDHLLLKTGDLRPRRDFTDVRDVVGAYWLALESASPGIYNVCSGEATAIADILAALVEQSGLEVEQQTDPGRLRAHEVMDIHGSHRKLTEATGWRPELPLEQTLADTLGWWRAEVRSGVAR